MTAVRRPEPMDLQTFLAWEDSQEEKHELIDGIPVPRRLRLMAGGTPEHALIAMNIGVALQSRLRGGPCRAFTSDLRVIVADGGLRYPDVTVLCRPLRRGDQVVADPKVLFEVLSPSNNPLQMTRLLHAYQGIASAEHIALVNQEAPFVQLWTRVANGWTLSEIDGAGESLALPAIGVSVPIAEFYDGVELAPSAPN